MRFIDAIVRQGHLSERALIDAMAGGPRPAHLDRCDLCAERALVLARWMDEIRVDGIEAADAVFGPEELAAQQARIMRRLEQADSPARVISFPAGSRPDRVEFSGRRVARSWVGIAAAAGLLIGVAGGQISARLMISPAQPAPQTAVQDAQLDPVDRGVFDRAYDQLHLSSYEALDEVTPRLTQVAARTGG